VAVATALAHAERGGGGGASPGRSALALSVSLALQVGVNYANDYSDGIRGTDDVRVGPVRLVGQRLAEPRSVKRAAFAAFGVAALAGLALALLTTPLLIAVGLAAIAAAWGYTGGPRPYGYAGLGEAVVFVFFGVVAVVGSVYVQLERIPPSAWVASVPVGLLAVSLLVVNNLRDIPSDTSAGKRTLAVRLGDGPTRLLYVGCISVSLAAVPVMAVVADRPAALIALASAAAALGPVRTVIGGASGRALVAVLGATGRLQVVFGALLAVGLAVGSAG
jgi:1,4-dihydroxy-2-naphthoate octaprenyltransferase